ncbi:MAG: DUF5989 family protein [Planctomycetota bacterium]
MFKFLKENLWWWLTPIILVVVLLGVVIWLTGDQGGLAPFIYSIF